MQELPLQYSSHSTSTRLSSVLIVAIKKLHRPLLDASNNGGAIQAVVKLFHLEFMPKIIRGKLNTRYNFESRLFNGICRLFYDWNYR